MLAIGCAVSSGDQAEVGDNQPYAMDGVDYTAPRHAIANGLDYLEIEVRQDLLADEPRAGGSCGFSGAFAD